MAVPLKSKVVIVSLAVVFLLTLLVSWPGVRALYYQRLRGGDLIRIEGERRVRLANIWTSICDFHTQTGAFPISRVDWNTVEPDVVALLRPPRWSDGVSYEVRFDLLSHDEGEMIVLDPGISWPGDLDGDYEQFRVGLRGDGAIVYYLHREIPTMLARSPKPCP